MRPRLVPYLAALLLGGVLAIWAYPGWPDIWIMPPGAPRGLDYAQHVIGQRYFLADRWHWPHLLYTANLDAPFGANIGLTDSLPLPALLAKPFDSLLPDGFNTITAWLALCWLLQPVAAVFLLRSFGETRLLPSVAVAVFASATPTFLLRLDHEALCGHFCLMLALGLALRIVDPARHRPGALIAGGLLLIATLFIHPYLMLMVAAVLASAPLTLALRGDRWWRVAGSGMALGIGSVLVLARVFGYLIPAAAAPGFGVFSMNLLSPVWPAGSTLFAFPLMDATGGQYEGYQYLGAGVLLACAGAALLCGRRVLSAMRAHPGLVLGCVLLTVGAVSSRVYLGHWLLLEWPAPDVAGIVRASGRLFWPVVYLLEAGSVAALARLPKRTGIALLLACPLLQGVDSYGLLLHDKARLHATGTAGFDAPWLERVVRAHDLVSVYPPWPCDATFQGTDHLMQVLWVVARAAVPVDTAYTSRQTRPPACDIAAELRLPMAPGELRILVEGHADLAADIPRAAAECRRLGTLTLCSTRVATLDGLARM